MKKRHWTQTKRGKEILAKRSKRQGDTENGAPINQTPIFAYALGRIEAWIETYAASAGVPYEALATELGKTIQSKARR